MTESGVRHIATPLVVYPIPVTAKISSTPFTTAENRTEQTVPGPVAVEALGGDVTSPPHPSGRVVDHHMDALQDGKTVTPDPALLLPPSFLSS